MRKNTVFLEELMVRGQASLDPRNSPNEEFELFSIPAYDRLEPDYVLGSEVGSSKKIVEPGDLLLSRIVPHIRRAWVVPTGNGKRQIASGEWIVFRHHSFEPRYLRHFVMGDPFHAQFMNTVAGVGGSLVRARPENVGRIEVSLPPLSEQKRIADILDKADAIRRKRQEGIRLTEVLLHSTFLEMFGAPTTNPKGWLTAKLGTVSSIRRGSSPRPIANYMGGDIPWVKIGDATANGDSFYITETEDHVTQDGAAKSVLLEPGSLVIANSGVSLGFARILKIRGCVHDGWLSVEKIDERLNKVYLLRLVNCFTEHFRSIAPDGTQPNLNTGIIKEFLVPIPPIDLQRKFEKAAFAITELTAAQKRATSDADSLFKSTVQQAFRGEL